LRESIEFSIQPFVESAVAGHPAIRRGPTDSASSETDDFRRPFIWVLTADFVSDAATLSFRHRLTGQRHRAATPSPAGGR
jgi:hypothetical protein